MEALHAECVSICREERRQRDALYAELAATRQQLSLMSVAIPGLSYNKVLTSARNNRSAES
jgi:hypothetical protein